MQQGPWSELDSRRSVAASQRPCLQRSSLHHDRIGRHAVDRTEGGLVGAFDPDPLPSAPPLQPCGGLQTPLKAASIVMSGRTAVGTSLPNADSYSHGCVRKEALLSLRIKGMRSPPNLSCWGERKPSVALHDVTGARIRLPERAGSAHRVARTAGNSPSFRRPRHPNVQMSSRFPIAVVLIGTCPITRNCVAQKPNWEARRGSH